jgi:hypothetical protein
MIRLVIANQRGGVAKTTTAHTVARFLGDAGGTYAASLHAQPRATKDMDILIQPEVANADAVYATLGAPVEGLNPADFAERGSFFRLGREPVAVDILSEIPGVDFSGEWSM